jgi:Transposase DDE domain
MAKSRTRPATRRPSVALVHEVDPLPLWPQTVPGGALVKTLTRHVQDLRRSEAHGNRALHLDHVFVAYLLAFFNPSIRSLRTIEDFSQTQQAQKHLSIPKICRGTLSDFQKIADPQRLGPILQALKAELTRQCGTGRLPAELHTLHKKILAVDGTFLPAVAEVAWAVKARNQRQGQCHRARLDWHVDIRTWLPELVVAPDPGQSEPDSAARQLTPGSIALDDRLYLSFDLIATHDQEDPRSGAVAARAEFVIRRKQEGANAPAIDEVQSRPLDADAVAAGVVLDRLVRLPGFEKATRPRVTLREVVVTAPDGQPVQLLTNLLDLPPHGIALLYKNRWQIELFFRWLKCYAHFNHLISHGRDGVLLNFYVVIIGVLLMYLHTNYRPSKYAFALLGAAAAGASLEEILPILRERERPCEVARQGAAQRRANAKRESR